MPKACSIEACEKKYYARGWCEMHYKRWLLHGTPDHERTLFTPQPCAVVGCPRLTSPKSAQGLCTTHYSRWQRLGDAGAAESLMPTRGMPVEDRFWMKVDKDGPTHDYAPHLGPCWPWTAQIIDGYGRFDSHGKLSSSVLAHRIAYELLVGPIPEGMTLDHLCHTLHPGCFDGVDCPHRRCVNPAHLEPVPAMENTLRGNAPSIVTARTKICQRGHDLSVPVNVKPTPNGGQVCRVCLNLGRMRRYYEGRAEGVANRG